MSNVVPNMTAPVPSSPSHADGSSRSIVPSGTRRSGGESAPRTDSAELSGAARRRLSTSADADVRLEDPIALATHVAELLHHAADTGAVHRVAVGTLARLVD